MEPSVAVIIPTTGEHSLIQAVDSVLAQTYKNVKPYIIIDGPEFTKTATGRLYRTQTTSKNSYVIQLPENVGKNGFYGHRIFAALPHIINTEFVMFLDQDCWFEENHVESLVDLIKSYDLNWGYSLRNIVEVDGTFVCQDNCESLGKFTSVINSRHIDTNCFCLKTSTAIKTCHAWHNGYGADRVFYNFLEQIDKNYNCTKEYTVNYRLGGNENSVKAEFFEHYNKLTLEKYNNNFPWSKDYNNEILVFGS